MRILILHSRYVSGDASGENKVVDDEFRLLREAGHEVLVWAPSPDTTGALGYLRAGMSAMWSSRAAREVARVQRRDGIEVVHVHNLFPALSPAVIRSARSAGAAVIVTLHNYRLMCLPANLLREKRVCEECVGHLPWRGVAHGCYRDSVVGSAVLASSLALHRSLGTFDAVSRFLAISEFVRRKHIEAGIHPARITVKPNFTWPTAPREGPGTYFLFLGRLAPEEGVDTLLQAWEIDKPALPLVVAGDGPDAEALRRAAPPGVEFAGLGPGNRSLASSRGFAQSWCPRGGTNPRVWRSSRRTQREFRSLPATWVRSRRRCSRGYLVI